VRKTAIIILNWNGIKDTRECLDSLRKITYPGCEIFVADNHSEGPDVEILKKEYPGFITLIENDQNYGFAGGHNRAIKYVLGHSKPEYLILLNNDTVVDADFVTRLVEAAERDTLIGMAGPKILFYDAKDRIQNAGCRINMFKGSAKSIGFGHLDSEQYPAVLDVDYVDACILVKREVIERIGYLDESYFCYWEDIDFCSRAREAGYRVICASQARIWHKKPFVPGNKKKVIGGGQVIQESPYVIYYITRNMFKFLKKHDSIWQYSLFILYFFVFKFWYSQVVLLLWRQDMNVLSSYYRGVGDGLSIK
jgi:GT2 family glycosyltransferase